MDPANPAGAELRFRDLDALCHFIRRFNVIHLDVDNADTNRDLLVDILQRFEVIGGTMRKLEDNMVRVQPVQKIEQCRPMPFLNRLSAVIAKAQMHRPLYIDRVQHPIDRLRRQRSILRIAGNVGFVYLNALAGQLSYLFSENIRESARTMMKQTLEGCTATYGAAYSLAFSGPNYPVTVNDTALTAESIPEMERPTDCVDAKTSSALRGIRST